MARKGLKSTSNRTFGSKKRLRAQQLANARKQKQGYDNNEATTENAAEEQESILPSSSSVPITSDKIESALQRKFRLFDEALDTDASNKPKPEVSGKATFVYVDTSLLENVVKTLGCSSCQNFGQLKMEINSHGFGMASKLIIKCEACESIITETMTSKRCKAQEFAKQTSFEVNRRATLASLYSGYGFGKINKINMVMGMTGMHKKTFVDQCNAIGKVVKESVKETLEFSAACVRNAYRDIGINPDEHSILNIAVSFDGSWMKRGHVSNFGIGVAIDLLTGLVLDFEVLSKYCHACALKRRKLLPSDFEEWFEKHKNSCQKNFDGSSGAMEATSALLIWKRSIEKHKFRYTQILSDGDAKTHQTLIDADIYGPSHKIIKEECINHVGKRMFTALGKVLSESRAQGQTLGGKGPGKLTRTIQDKLANYYRKAIWDNTGDIEAMRNAVFATLFHSISTDDEPHHSRCPQGANSWCFYNKAVALGIPSGEHEKNVSTHISREVGEKILPVYQRLGDIMLLRRCLKGKTQNSNESLHSVVWTKCPKTSFLHLDRVTLGVGMAVIDFNYGHRGIQKILEKLGIEPGEQTSFIVASSDRKRKLKSAERATSKAKRAREMKRTAHVQLEQRLLEQGGGLSYEAGAF